MLKISSVALAKWLRRGDDFSWVMILGDEINPHEFESRRSRFFFNYLTSLPQLRKVTK